MIPIESLRMLEQQARETQEEANQLQAQAARKQREADRLRKIVKKAKRGH